MKTTATTASGRNFSYEHNTRPNPGKGLVIGADYIEGCFYCRVLIRVFGGLNASPYERAEFMKAVEWMKMPGTHAWLCNRCKDNPEARDATPKPRSNRAAMAQGFGFVDPNGNFMGMPMAMFQQPGAPAPAPGQMPPQGQPQQLQAPQQQQQPAPPQLQAPQQAPQPQPQNGYPQQPQAVAPVYPLPAPQRGPQPVPQPQALQQPYEAPPQQQMQGAPPQQPYAFQYTPQQPQQPSSVPLPPLPVSSLGRRARRDWRTHAGSPAAPPPERQPPHHVHFSATTVTPDGPETDLSRVQAIASGEPGAPQPAAAHPPTLPASPSPEPSESQSQTGS